MSGYSEHLIAARAALADEARDLTERLGRVQRALAMLDGDAPLPLVRPPAPSVPEPSVTLPKCEPRPKPTEQRPAAKAGRKPTVDYARVTEVCLDAIERGVSTRRAVAASIGDET